MNKRHLTEVEQFYQLLPAIYRLRDAEQGYPLRAFLAILAEQGQIVEADMARLYANWFIESCEEWVVPYIGDLLGVRGLRPAGEAGWSQRALVANTLRYRRRKGTPALLEQIVYDVTGWAAHAVELYERVGTTQYLDHLRAGSGGTANLKQLNDPHLIGSAFDPLAYTPDVRLMAGTRQSPVLAARLNSGLGQRVVSVGQARPNLSAIGLYIWRLKPYQLERVTAYDHHDGKRFRFNPLGSDTQLFHKPAETPTFSRVAQEHELPVALRTAPLAAELCAYRQAQKDGRETNARFLKAPLPFAIYVGHHQPVALEDLWICDLSQWDNKQALTQ